MKKKGFWADVIGDAENVNLGVNRRSSMTITDRVEINPKVMMGKPVIRGTRVTVELILRKLGGGAKVKDLLEAYPRLTKEDIQAAIRYAADTLAREETVILGPPKKAARK
ncbi:MAG: DUF433 domain-containing protein [Candidatus Zixiibacteriota bacterium]